MKIPKARCLDAFAGSGALGLESLSRGATEVVFLEKANKAAEAIRNNIDILSLSSRATLYHTDSFQWLKRPQEAFDIIFLDPPFGQEGIQTALQHIEDNHLLLPEGLIYIEMENCRDWPISEHWSLLKSKTLGQVQFGLFEYTKAN
jgi:16S rRNA (guanine966-N2)-methyltransferase